MGNSFKKAKEELNFMAEEANTNFSTTYGPDPTTREPIRAIAYEPPRFEPTDPDIASYLRKHGYVVVKGVANDIEIQQARDLFWNYLETQAGMKRDDPQTWTDERFTKIGSTRTGIIFYRGIQHSDVLWYIRCLPKVKIAFQQVFGTDDLITSYDGGNIFRPWHLEESDTYSKTHSGWYHVDQGRLLPGFHCVQGLVTLKDVTAATGGFCCIPESHLYHNQLIEGDTSHNPERNYIKMPHDFHPVGVDLPLPELLISCKAGDLILWDSRTIHCNTPALVDPIIPSIESDSLLRMVCYVCMGPTEAATPAVLQQRIKLFEYGIGTNHWPHLFNGMDVESAIEGKIRIKDINQIPVNQRALIAGNAPSRKIEDIEINY